MDYDQTCRCIVFYIIIGRECITDSCWPFDPILQGICRVILQMISLEPVDAFFFFVNLQKYIF